MEAAETPSNVTVNVSTINALLGWALKLAPLIGSAILFFFTLYSNQATLLKHDEQLDKRLKDMDTAHNLELRETAKHDGQVDARIEGLRHDLDFYTATKPR